MNEKIKERIWAPYYFVFYQYVSVSRLVTDGVVWLDARFVRLEDAISYITGNLETEVDLESYTIIYDDKEG
jgi:hypothetical protein